MKKIQTRFGIVISLALLITTLTACGSSYSGSSSQDYKNAYPMSAVTESVWAEDSYSEYESSYIDNGFGSDSSEAVNVDESAANTSKRKLIRNVNLDLETKEFDLLLENLNEKVKAYGGYIENQTINNGSSYSSYRSSRYSSVTVRIPQARLDEFINNITEISNVTYKSESVDDVTLTYVDIESRKKAYETEQRNLYELMDRAESIEDLITIESRLAEVRYQIESMESQLRTYDNKVDYSTIYMDIQEVKELTPVVELTTGEKITQGFKESLEEVRDGFVDAFVDFVINLPHIIVWAVFIGIVVLIVTKINKRRHIKDGTYGMSRKERMELYKARSQDKVKEARESAKRKREAEKAEKQVAGTDTEGK